MINVTISEKIIKLLAKPGRLSEVEQKSIVDMLKNDKAISETIRAINNAPNNMLKKLIQRIDANKNRHELIGFLGQAKLKDETKNLIRNEIQGLAERRWICLFNQKNIPQCSKNFVILLGGTGEYDSKDPDLHDSTWKNFVVPIQISLKKKNVTAGANESLHFFVYEPAYKKRWESDVKSKIDFIQKDVEQIKNKATNYLDRINQIAKENNAEYHGIQNVRDFWSKLAFLETIQSAGYGILVMREMHSGLQ
ncbi:MAG: hypothetical protein HC877_02025 [Thioploca sp.]|nr:hypothetical protein [Thioploca sp.]